MSAKNGISKRWGLLTGYAIVLMALVAGFVYGFVHETIHIAGDAEKTAALLRENMNLYKLGIASWLLIALLDVVVALGLYHIYQESQKNLAMLTAALRMIYTLFLGAAIVQLLQPLAEQKIADSLLYFETFEKIWSLGLIVFGFHLLALGVTCLKSSGTPAFWGVFLGFGGGCYILVHGLKAFFPQLADLALTLESMLMAPMALSELGFAVWLIVKFSRLK